MENPEMKAQPAKAKTKTRSKAAENELTKYNISRVSTDQFHYGDYKYTDLKDAVAQAKRDLKAAEA